MSKHAAGMDPQKELDDIVSRVRRRMFLQHIGLWLQKGLLFGLLTAILIQLMARWVLLEYYRGLSLYAVCLFVAAAAVYGWLRRPSKQHAIRWMDNHGLNEQMTTAQQFMLDPSPVAAMQREEALSAGKVFIQTLAERMRWQVHRRTLLLLLGGLIGFMGLFLLPNKMDDHIAARHAAKQWTEEQLQRIDAAANEWQEEKAREDVSEQVLQELLALRDQLAQAKDPSDALSQMEQALQRLEQQAKLLEQEEHRLEQWIDEQNHSELAKQFAEQMAQQGNGGANTEQWRQWQEQLAQAAADADKVKEQLQQLQQLNQALAQAGMEVAGALQERDISVSSAWREGGLASRIAAESANSGAAQSGAEAGVSDGLAQGDSQGNGNGASASEGGASGKGQNQGQGSGSGDNPDQGSGGATGSGQGSSAAGSGGQGSGSGTGSGAGTGSGSRDLITTPVKEPGQGETHVDSGPLQGSGGQQELTSNGTVQDGVSRPYDEVYAQYEAEASQSLNRTEWPQRLQHLVRDYFIELKPE